MITCGGCDRTWTGLRRAHCSACHQTFGGITSFDSHRRGDSCRTGASLGLELVSGVWRRPRGDFDPSEVFPGRKSVRGASRAPGAVTEL